MRIITLFTVILLLFSAAAYASKEATLTLEFRTEHEKQQWVEWYLDRGGEDQAGFFVQCWDNFNFLLINDIPEAGTTPLRVAWDSEECLLPRHLR